MKKCPKCKQLKDLSGFNKKGSGYQSYCRSCSNKVQKKYYKDNKQDFIDKARVRKEKLRDRIRKLREENPCVDCGKYYHYCQMDFDHIENKSFEISRGVSELGKSWDSLKNEISKCELVCSNCHRLRTFKRMEYSSRG